VYPKRRVVPTKQNRIVKTLKDNRFFFDITCGSLIFSEDSRIANPHVLRGLDCLSVHQNKVLYRAILVENSWHVEKSWKIAIQCTP
jgi:hypothetical protein